MLVWQKINHFLYLLNTNKSFFQMYVQNILLKILVTLTFPSGLQKTQSSDKLIKHFILKKYLFLQKHPWIFLNFWHDLKKWHFDVLFDVFLSEVRPWCQPADPPLFRLVLLLLQIPQGQEKSGQAVVRSPAWRQSELISFLSRAM
jgi:hypothetical protein